MSEAIIVSIISGVCVLASSLVAQYFANRKSSALILYRLDQLERKFDAQSKDVQRIPLLAEQVDTLKEQITRIDRNLAK